MPRIHLTDSPSLPYGAPVRTVKQTNALLQQTLSAHLPATFAVQAEISNFRIYDRGHAFFTLKEPGAELPAICWKDALARLKFKPKDGLSVIAVGTIKLYEPQGKLQLYVDNLFPLGIGELELAFRQLYDKLRQEGLFAPERKRPLPRLPQRIVILTSRTGDVLHDVLTTAYRRYPGLHTSLFPVPVQGPTAAPKIIEAIQQINLHNKKLLTSAKLPPQASSPKPQASPPLSAFSIQNSAFPIPIDLILLVRGGGSLEDLWPFNDESLARAIIASTIPIATGIGHEPDTTIADLVGDLRGPTPTAVTELTIPDASSLRREIDAHSALLTRDIRRHLQSRTSTLRHLSSELTQSFRTSLRRSLTNLTTLSTAIARIEPRHAIAQGWRRVEESERSLTQAQQTQLRHATDTLHQLTFRLEKSSPRTNLTRAQDRLTHIESQLHQSLTTRLAAAHQLLTNKSQHLTLISPQSILDRGYSITLTQEGKIIRSQSQVTKGQKITTKVADGEFISTIGSPKQNTLF